MTKAEVTRRDRTILVPLRGVEKPRERSARHADSEVLSNAEVSTEANSPGGASTPTDSPPQNVHRPLLADNAENDRDSDHWSEEFTLPILDGRTKAYGDWWREQIVGRENHSLFSVHLVGDASSPQLFTLMAQNDLAYFRYACCSSLSYQ